MLHWYNLLEFVLSGYGAKIALPGEDATWLLNKLPPSVRGRFMQTYGPGALAIHP